jgi:hypothetical protein
MTASLRPKRRTKKEVERLLLEEFLEHLRFKGAQLEKRERPDSQATWTDDDGSHRIGIEITQYQVDATKGAGSLARRLDGLEEQVIRVAQPRCMEAVPDFRQLEVCLSLSRSDPPKKRDIPAVGRQLADYLVNKKDAINQQPRRLGPSRQDAALFPLVYKHFGSIVGHLGPSGPRYWQSGGAAHIGVVDDVIVHILDKKRERRKGFDLTGLDECWLVICASGSTSYDAVGPPDHALPTLRSPDILVVARATGFDRVYFWERDCGWHECLFP